MKKSFLLISLIILIANVSSSSFSSDSFVESNEIIINPDQGFYKPLRVTMTPDSFDGKIKELDQLYHLRCHIGAFSGKVNSDKKDKKLTDKVLNALDDYLTKIKLQNKNAIIRFAYDYDGENDKEPSMSMMKTHIQQLGPIINKHLDVLTAVEAGMIGPWGEMHTSEVATEENKAEILKAWLENTKEIQILTRTPKTIYTYFGITINDIDSFKIDKSDKGYRLGLFNDCVFSNEKDYGTYKDRTKETKWFSTQNDHLAFGGEVCAVHDMNNLEVVLPEMYLMSLSYLNAEYNKKVIVDKWQNLNYNKNLGKDSIFYGLTGYHYIYAHMGYRLVLRSINVEYNKGGSFNLTAKIDNVGFGNLYRTKKVDIVYTDTKGKVLKRKKLGNYSGGNTLKLSGEFLEKEHADYKVYLSVYSSIEDDVVYYPIEFANDDIYDDKLKAHYLFLVKEGGKITN